MEPVIVLTIIITIPLAAYGGYLSYQWLSEWIERRREYKEYEEYVRQATEKYQSNTSASYEYRGFQDDDDTFAYTNLQTTMGGNHLRNRKPHAKMADGSIDYELTELQQSIMDRKRYLQEEQERLEEAEKELERRRHYLESRGNSILGVFEDEQQETFDDFRLHVSMTQQDPPVLDNPFDDSHRTENSVTERLSIPTEKYAKQPIPVSAGTDTVTQQIVNILPSSLADQSDSEESWAALSKVVSPEQRERTQSDSSDISFLATRSDKSFSSFGVASISEDEHR
ncbi:hypothetical protein EC973_002281 [Apophysomyces ossiformis]|uniref:Uncharacterized protein n=1 Tax=Apophysomyces ossiformis TaxID=679940 RepID=A0A8H7ELU7_9FUNG|nr:hypothetical protein EC973_002281 [Apophysomyces ossiformis]